MKLPWKGEWGKQERVGRTGILCARDWLPLPPWGLDEAQQRTLSRAPPCHIQPCVLELDELPGKQEEVSTLFLFQKFCFVYLHISVQTHPKGTWGLCPLDWKWCQGWAGLGKGRRGGWVASDGHSAGAKGRIPVFTLTLKKGKEGDRVQIKLGVADWGEPASL